MSAITRAPSRRGLLAGGAAALVAGAAAFQKPGPLPWRNGPRPTEPVQPMPEFGAAGDDAELLALHRTFLTQHAIVQAWNAGEVTEEIGEAAHDRWWECVEAMVDIPATTPEGLWAKAETALLATDLTGGHGGSDEELVRSVVRDITTRRARA